VKWIKVIDDPARAYAVALKYPSVNVIYRKVAPQDIEQLSDLRRHPEFSDAPACAEMFVRLADIAPLPNLWVEGANEVKLATVDDAQWYGRVEALRYKILKAKGLGVVVGNFATGNPTPEMFAVFMTAYFANGGGRDALMGQHEYGAFNVPAAQDKHNLLRHRMLRDATPSLSTGMRWAITECGLDRIQVGGKWVGGGWRAPGSGVDEGAYFRYMSAFDEELERDADVVCACIFSYGDTERWKDYEMNDAQAFNTSLVGAIAASAAPAAPVIETPLFVFDGAGTSIRLYTDAALSKLKTTVKASWKVEVFEVRGKAWRVTKGAAGLWMQPVALRVA